MSARSPRLLLAGLAGLLVFLQPAPAPAKPGHGFTHGHDDGDFAYALVREGGRWWSSSGSDLDDRALRDLAGDEGDLLWFRLDGREYVTRDRATLERAAEALAPVQRLGREQGRLGREQGRLGRQQGQLGARLGRLAAARVRARFADVDDEREDRALERERRAIARRMEELGSRQEELARRQEPLAREQERLGREQAKASREAGAELRRIAERAVRSGEAERVE